MVVGKVPTLYSDFRPLRGLIERLLLHVRSGHLGTSHEILGYENYQFSSLGPKTAPRRPLSSMPVEYHTATKAAEASGHAKE